MTTRVWARRPGGLAAPRAGARPRLRGAVPGAACAALLATLAAACARGDADAPGGAGRQDSVNAGTAGSDAAGSGAAPTDGSGAPGPVSAGGPDATPPQVYVDSGACPYECCVYREWLARDAVPVRPREADTTGVAFTLAAGERFEALTGNVHLDPTGMALIRREMVDAYGNPAPRFAVGDTLYVLSYQGEGFYNVWSHGEVSSEPACWGPAVGPGASEPACELLREPVQRWWVHARNAAGDDGWIDMDAYHDAIGQRDACGVD